MADIYNENDELSRVVEWLKANGAALVIGVVLGLAIIVGWQWWNVRVDSRAQAAAQLYGSVAGPIESGQITDSVRAKVEQLKQDYAGSPYAANAAFKLAARAMEQKQYDQAISQLDWVIENSESVPARNVAQLRKARTLWSTGDAEAALSLLEAKHPDSFDRLFAELAGDIQAARGNRPAAHAAYQRAAAAATGGVATGVLQRKLAQTAASQSSSIATATSEPSTDEGA